MSETIDQILSAPIVRTTMLGLGAVVVCLWLVACWWAYKDAARRASAELPRWLAAAWILLSGPLFLPFSVAIYTLLRPQEATADRRTRELVATLETGEPAGPLCPGCAAAIDPDWARCPACRLWLGRPCERCERLAPLDALMCPWCAWEPDGVADGEAPGVAAAVGGTLEAMPQLEIEVVPVAAASPVVSASAAAGVGAAAAGATLSASARPGGPSRPWRRRHAKAPGEGRSREDETVAWAGGPLEA